MRTNYLIIIFFLLLNNILSAQFSFLGFDQAACYAENDFGYSYENIYTGCGSHSIGYVIKKDGVQVFSKCTNDYTGFQLKNLFFINDSTGFAVEWNTYVTNLIKTSNYGKSWDVLTNGYWVYLNSYILNEDEGILVTTTITDPPNLKINGKEYTTKNDTVIEITIKGIPSCKVDSLSFKVSYNNDTIQYIIMLDYSLSGLKNLKDADDIKIYPNPSIDYITIDGIENSKYKKVIIRDQAGIIIKIFISDKNEFYVGDLKSGCYFIEIKEMKNTNMIWTKCFIKL